MCTLFSVPVTFLKTNTNKTPFLFTMACHCYNYDSPFSLRSLRHGEGLWPDHREGNSRIRNGQFMALLAVWFGSLTAVTGISFEQAGSNRPAQTLGQR